MSRAFVINGDEWGFCIKMSRKCSGANAEGACMRDECTEIPEWERPKRSLDELRKAKIEEALKEAEKAKKEAELQEKIARAQAIMAKRREERMKEAAKQAVQKPKKTKEAAPGAVKPRASKKIT